MRFPHRLPVILGVLCGVTACGDDPVSSGPSTLNGDWTYTATSLTGVLPENPLDHPNFRNVAATCSVSPTTMVVRGSRDAVVGEFFGAVLTCGLLNQGSTHLGTDGRQVYTQVIGPLSGPVEDGAEQQDEIRFRFTPESPDVLEWTHRGRLAPDVTGGEVEITTVLGGEVVRLEGRWTATRN